MKGLFGRILLSVLIAAMLCVGSACGGDRHYRLAVYPIGEKVEVDTGTLTLEEIAVADRAVKDGKELVGSGRSLLIFKLHMDFDKYALKNCGTEILFLSDGKCQPVFNAEITAALSPNLRIVATEAQIDSSVFLCFDLTEEEYDRIYKDWIEAGSEPSEGKGKADILLQMNGLIKSDDSGIYDISLSGEMGDIIMSGMYSVD